MDWIKFSDQLPESGKVVGWLIDNKVKKIIFHHNGDYLKTQNGLWRYWDSSWDPVLPEEQRLLIEKLAPCPHPLVKLSHEEQNVLNALQYDIFLKFLLDIKTHQWTFIQG